MSCSAVQTWDPVKDNADSAENESACTDRKGWHLGGFSVAIFSQNIAEVLQSIRETHSYTF